LEAADPEEARLVLPVLLTILEVAQGEPVLTLTRGQGAWLAKIRHAAPALELHDSWLMALHYRAREIAQQDTGDLDAMLAFLQLAAASNWPSGELRRQTIDFNALLRQRWPERAMSPWTFAGLRAAADIRLGAPRLPTAEERTKTQRWADMSEEEREQIREGAPRRAQKEIDDGSAT
jgi:hypothetical protein